MGTNDPVSCTTRMVQLTKDIHVESLVVQTSDGIREYPVRVWAGRRLLPLSDAPAVWPVGYQPPT